MIVKRFCVCLYGKNILINTIHENIAKSIKTYFKHYISKNLSEDLDFTFYILIDSDLYNNEKIQHLCKKRYFKNGTYYLIFKNNEIIINKKTKEVRIISKRYDNDFLDDVNRIILNVLYVLLSLSNIFFVQAGGIIKDNFAIVLMGNKNLVKDIIANLLEKGYNYMAVETIGLKEENGNINVFSLPEKTRLRENFQNKIIRNVQLKEIIILENDFNLKSNSISQIRKEEFINIFKSDNKNNSNQGIDFINRIFIQEKKIEINYENIYNNIDVFKYKYRKYEFDIIYEDIYNIISE